MKKLLFLIPLLSLVLSCTKEPAEDRASAPKAETEAGNSSGAPISGSAIIKISDDLADLVEDDIGNGMLVTRSLGLNEVLDELGAFSVRRLFPDAGVFEPRTRKAGLHKWYVVEYSENQEPTRAALEFEAVRGVEFAENERKIKTCAFNDPSLDQQWQYANVSTLGADINVQPVWDFYTTGVPEVVVAVVDGGIEQTHPDLAANCFNDNHNFVNGTPTIVAYDHGTHVAGIIGAVNNNGTGVCGVAGGNSAAGARGVSLMSCQVFQTEVNDGVSTTKTGSTAQAIKWAADHGAVIAQNSWAYDYDKNADGKLTDSELTDALAATVSASDKAAIDYFIEYAGCGNDGAQLSTSPMKGGLVVFAAGNEGIANGAPGNYDPVVAVGAITSQGVRASYSNYGAFVDIAAPGSGIYSTLPDGKYGFMSGTSMACPFVSGVAALVLSCRGGQGFTNQMLKNMLIGGANTSVLSPSYEIGGLVDALGAVLYGKDSAPEAVDDLTASVTSNNITLSWSVPSGPSGKPAYGFKVFYGKDKESVESSDPSSESVSGVTSLTLKPGLAVGEAVACVLSNLEFESDYFVKVYAHSYYNHYSPSTKVLGVTSGENNPPVIECEYSEVSLKAYESYKITLSVSDPDGHSLNPSYKQGSEADAFAAGPFGGYEINITAAKVEAGTYTSVLTVADKYGASASKEFTYTVLANNPPVRIKDADNLLLASKGTEFYMNMSDYFSDADGEALSYSVTLSDNSVAFLNYKDGKMTGTILKYGLTSATIKATDVKGKSAEISFKILARDPSVTCQLYPVPVTTILNVATGEDLAETAVTVVSSTGKTVFDESIQASAFVPGQVDMTSAAPGTYFVTVKSKGLEFEQTIVKK